MGENGKARKIKAFEVDCIGCGLHMVVDSETGAVTSHAEPPAGQGDEDAGTLAPTDPTGAGEGVEGEQEAPASWGGLDKW
jgi:hypothetical protein